MSDKPTEVPTGDGLTALNAHGQDWRDWVITNLERNCDLKDMHGKMVKGLWTDLQAAEALQQGLQLLGINRSWLQDLPSLPGTDALDLDGTRLVVLGRFDKPRAALLAGVLSAQECADLIDYAFECGLKRSPVVDGATGLGVANDGRTSTSVFFQRSQTPLIARIEARLAALTGWPVSHGEGLQVLRYEPGQQYKPHFDWFDPAKTGTAKHLERGGQRVATTVMYLANADKGGGTRFPKSGVEIFPRAGGAVFFNNVLPWGELDDWSLHSGTPVEQGVKIVATYWQRERAFT